MSLKVADMVARQTIIEIDEYIQAELFLMI